MWSCGLFEISAGVGHSGRRFTVADHCVHAARGQIVGPARSGSRGSPWAGRVHCAEEKAFHAPIFILFYLPSQSVSSS